MGEPVPPAARAPRRVLVLGGTGHLGQALLREGLAAGWALSTATRGSRPEALAGLDVQVLRGDADAPGQLARWVRGHDAVIDAAAPYPMNLFVGEGPAAMAPRVQARTRMAALLQACAHEGAALLHVSSFTTLPRPAGEGAWAGWQAAVRRRLHPYFAVKAEMEAMALAAARAGQTVVVVNPTACMGPWDRRPRDLCVLPLLATGQVPVMLSQPMNVLDVRDMAHGARLALERAMAPDPRPEGWAGPIALSGPNSDTETLARQVCRLAGVAPPRLRWPGVLAAGSLLAVEAGWALLGRPSPVPALGPLLVLDGHVREPSAAQRALGLVPRPLHDTLRDALAWYRELGHC